jgi:hypothetical protein
VLIKRKELLRDELFGVRSGRKGVFSLVSECFREVITVD